VTLVTLRLLAATSQRISPARLLLFSRVSSYQSSYHVVRYIAGAGSGPVLVKTASPRVGYLSTSGSLRVSPFVVPAPQRPGRPATSLQATYRHRRPLKDTNESISEHIHRLSDFRRRAPVTSFPHAFLGPFIVLSSFPSSLRFVFYLPPLPEGIRAATSRVVTQAASRGPLARPLDYSQFRHVHLARAIHDASPPRRLYIFLGVAPRSHSGFLRRISSDIFTPPSYALNSAAGSSESLFFLPTSLILVFVSLLSRIYRPFFHLPHSHVLVSCRPLALVQLAVVGGPATYPFRRLASFAVWRTPPTVRRLVSCADGCHTPMGAVRRVGFLRRSQIVHRWVPYAAWHHTPLGALLRAGFLRRSQIVHQWVLYAAWHHTPLGALLRAGFLRRSQLVHRWVPYTTWDHTPLGALLRAGFLRRSQIVHRWVPYAPWHYTPLGALLRAGGTVTRTVCRVGSSAADRTPMGAVCCLALYAARRVAARRSPPSVHR
jgi:predicted DNA-binding transcriptional regulator